MDAEPKNLSIGAINPYALTEAITGRKIDWSKATSIKLMEDALETNYHELFDMKFNSPIYAGLKLDRSKMAVPLKMSDIKIRKSADAESPDLSDVKNLEDLTKKGVKNVKNLEVDSAILFNGKLKVIFKTPDLDKSISKTLITPRMKEILFSDGVAANQDWTPTNGSWRDMGDFFNDVGEYNDPIQGAVGNCYFIAAMAAVVWSDPFSIEHKVRAIGTGETQRTNAIKFFTKGGGKDAPTKQVEVTDSTLVRTNNNTPIYCRSNDAGEIWPALYEKAFAKWITKTNSDKPDITKTAFGDPAKATAQINGKKAYYYNTSSRSGDELYSIVRGNSRSYKTFNPMTAWTYGSGNYSGTNVVANHAYTILGWAYKNNKK